MAWSSRRIRGPMRLYADKRNLMLLSDEAALVEMGVPEATRRILLAGIPRTVAVDADAGRAFLGRAQALVLQAASRFRQPRRLSRRQTDQARVRGNPAGRLHRSGNRRRLPSIRSVVEDESQLHEGRHSLPTFINGAIQLVAARLYQGQTTNFRTPGGGFAPVFPA
jgi:hypothetical protein